MVQVADTATLLPIRRKAVLFRLDPEVHKALARRAADELRSTNAQIEFLLRRALVELSRIPPAGGAPDRLAPLDGERPRASTPASSW